MTKKERNKLVPIQDLKPGDDGRNKIMTIPTVMSGDEEMNMFTLYCLELKEGLSLHLFKF